MSKWFSPATVLSYNKAWSFVIGPRSGGKTFNTILFLIDRFRKSGEQWILIRRTQVEIDNIKDNLFAAIQAKGFYSDDQLTIEGNTMLLNGMVMGKLVALNNAHSFKMANFPYVSWILFDEFIPEEGTYKMKNEVAKMLGFWVTVKREREVRCIFLANSLSLNNEFFQFFNVKIPRGTKIYQHPSRPIAVQIYFNEELAEEQRNSDLGAMISDTQYEAYMIDNQFILDNYTFVEAMDGPGVYQFTYIFEGRKYGVYWQQRKGIYHINAKVEPSCPTIYSFTTDDHQPNFVLFDTVRKNPYIKRLLGAHAIGKIRFDTITTKNAFYELCNYL